MYDVSIICVYNNIKVLNEYLKDSLNKQNALYELILVNNRSGKFNSAASALNYGAKKATGKYLIFVHQDINLTNPNWINETINQIEHLDNPGIIGVAGKTDDRFIRTNIKHGIPPVPVSYFKLKKPEKASTLDECAFIIPHDVFNKLQFDEKTCFDWHLYATDYVLSVKKLGYEAYIIPTELEHRSKGSSLSNGYYKTLNKLQRKYFNEKIIRNCMADWYTFIPISIQKKMKKYNNNHLKLNFFDKYMYNKDINKNYHKIDKETYNLIKNSNLFDENYYKKTYKINTKKFDPLTHFATVGYLNGYNPSLNFDTSYYCKKYYIFNKINGDVNPLIHYLKYGKKQGFSIKPVINKSKLASLKHKILKLSKTPKLYLLIKSKFNLNLYKKYFKDYNLIKSSGLFDYNYYIENYPTVKNFNNDYILHYMFIGYHFGYKPNYYFDIDYYRKKFGLNKNPLLTFLKDKENSHYSNLLIEDHDLIKSSGLFDYEYYTKNYPDFKKYFKDPIYHYLIKGYKEGCNPSNKFNNNWYLNTYSKVKKIGLSPLVYYLKYGIYNKHIPKPITKNESNEIKLKIDEYAHKTPLYNFDDNSPLVSIIILTRNGIDYLKTLFKNFEETICYPNYEIIVIDNNSSDGTLEYLNKLSKKLPLKIIKNDVNERFSEANNKGVKYSKGEYILLLNNDMEPIYGWLNHMMHTYLKSDDIGIVGAKLIFPFKKNNSTSLKTQNEGIKYDEFNGFLTRNDGYIVPYNIKGGNVFDNEKEKEMPSILGASLLIKKDLYQELGGLDEEYIYNYEDIDLCFKAINKGYKIIYEPKAKLYHYYQATRKEAFDVSPNDMKNRIYLYKKWNKWLSEKLFIDKINNKLIFSEKPLKITYISNNLLNIKNDFLLNKNDLKSYNYSEYLNKYYKGIKIDKLGWELDLLKNENSKLKIKHNTDIIVSDDYNFNPNYVIKNNKHQVKIAIINSEINKWLNLKNYEKYDILLINKDYFDKLDNNLNKFVLNDYSIFKQIKDILLNIHSENLIKFNNIIKNYDFEKVYPNAKDYLYIAKSNYFDEKWYSEHYNIVNKRRLDPAGHYLKIGGIKGYNPSTKFNSKNYFKANPDLKNLKINPLLHYEKYGKKEGREINCSDNDVRLYNKYLFLTNDKIYHLTKRLFRTKNNQILFYSPWTNETEGELNENSKIIYDNLSNKYDKIIYTRKRILTGDYWDLLHKFLESKVIIIDNGCSLLNNINLKNNQYIINIWHACGAFKKIGYDAPIYNGKTLDLFKKEFSQYTNFIVSSKNISKIYADAHGMDENNVLGLGVPRTDIFYDEEYKKNLLNKFYEDYPYLVNKKIILYAPTFRDNYKFKTGINWDKLSDKLDDDEVFIIKRHIRIEEDLLEGKRYDNIFYLEDESIYTLMLASKLMISDYSSVIFEYSLLDKPLIHYCPDYEEYLSVRDFYLDFKTDLYGDIIEDPDELIDVLDKKNYKVNNKKLKLFFNKFMSACDGHSTERIIKLIEKYMNS
ncbi:MAG: CDP-glycerol glycerophosphotransferase family protein [Methanobrevibacter wolinii]|nr:CDP-glycerol glycerophosphotransferase family protein [Methanobrevibacter wolinii]